MKHFQAQTGGRYTYVDDIINLQNLALAINSIFSDCDNFIISGCKVVGASISSGYVYINGEIRFFRGASNVGSFPQYICEHNTIENTSYASGSEKVGRYCYDCILSESIPSSNDEITGVIPQYIAITSTGGKTIKDAFFGKYALLRENAAEQEIDSPISFDNTVKIRGAFSAYDIVKVISGSGVGQIYWSGNNLVIQSQVSSEANYKFVLTTEGFEFYVDSALVYMISASGIQSVLPISSTSGVIGGNLKIAGSDIYNHTSDYDDACVKINMLGYDGSNSKYRNTLIGNGKGVAIITVDGLASEVLIDGVTSINSPDIHGLIIKSAYAKTSEFMLKDIAFRDVDDAAMALIGFSTVGSKNFSIVNYLENINIEGVEYVNITPAIKENGELLSNKYVLATTYSQGMESKANSSDVYTKQQTGQLFGKLTEGLSQFVVGNVTQAMLREQIGAISAEEAIENTPRLDSYLSDMATDDIKKAQIRQNIGAAEIGQYEPKVSDSGWINIIWNKLYVRQIGKVVCIQGKLITNHSGVQFTLPNDINAPAYDVTFECSPSYNTKWACKIVGGTKVCVVTYCNNHGATIPFSMTYMTE